MKHPTFGERGVYRWKINGKYANGDAYVMQYGATANPNTDVPQVCDGCGRFPMTFPFFCCTECNDNDFCQECLNKQQFVKPSSSASSPPKYILPHMRSSALGSSGHQTEHLLFHVANWAQYVSVINSQSIHACCYE